MSKRLLGYRSWHRRRHREHREEVLAALVDDVAAAMPDHVLVTSDLVNITLPGEFDPARRWPEALGAPEGVSVIPGNHDRFGQVPGPDGAVPVLGVPAASMVTARRNASRRGEAGACTSARAG